MKKINRLSVISATIGLTGLLLSGCSPDHGMAAVYGPEVEPSTEEEVEYSEAVSSSETEVESEQSTENEDFVLPDWNHYEDQMSAEDKKDFDEYLAVLNGDEKFFCFDWGGDKERSFNDYLSSIESKSEPDIDGVALVDFDDQNGRELVIGLYEGGGNFLVLTRDSGKFYGTSMGARCFEELQKNGKFLGAGGAGDAYYCTMKIDSNGAELNRFGELHGEEKADGSYGDRLEVNGEVIEEAQKWIEENYSDPVAWIQ